MIKRGETIIIILAIIIAILAIIAMILAIIAIIAIIAIMAIIAIIAILAIIWGNYNNYGPLAIAFGDLKLLGKGNTILRPTIAFKGNIEEIKPCRGRIIACNKLCIALPLSYWAIIVTPATCLQLFVQVCFLLAILC